MAIPIIQQIRVGAYIIKQKLLRRKKYPLVLMLEPLFRCNLACAGCGKIDYPKEILNQRLSTQECIDAVEELRRHAAHMKKSLDRDLLSHERKD